MVLVLGAVFCSVTWRSVASSGVQIHAIVYCSIA